ncbi:MAG: diversity-generating retroelement protein Avd [Pseudomonadota bacterium]
MPKEVDAVIRLYDFILWMIPKLEKFPRNQKFLLGDRMENLMLDILELLIEATYSRNKQPALFAANMKLEKLRYLIRLAKDLKLISIKGYAFSANAMDGIGKSVGGQDLPPWAVHGFHNPRSQAASDQSPYRDRVVHHALCNVIEPIFERTFSHDSYACRKGKGTHAAVDRYTAFARKNAYVLKCDIRKYFQSIDHEILMSAVAGKIRCADTQWLISEIICSRIDRTGTTISDFVASVLKPFQWFRSALESRLSWKMGAWSV